MATAAPKNGTNTNGLERNAQAMHHQSMTALMHEDKPDHPGSERPAVKHAVCADRHEHGSQAGELCELQRAKQVLSLPREEHARCADRGQSGRYTVPGRLWRAVVTVHLALLLLLLGKRVIGRSA